MSQQVEAAGAKPTGVVVKTPWFYGWNIVVAGAIIQAVGFGIGLSSFGYLAPGWIAEFKATEPEVMWATTGCTLALGVIAPFAGRILDKAPIRLLVLFGAICFVAGLLLVSVATAMWQIIVIYVVILSLGMTFNGPLGSSTMTAKWFRGRRGLALGLASSGSSIGGMIFPPIVTNLLSLDGGWREAYVTLAIVSAVILLPIAWLVIRSSPEDAGIEPEPESERSRALAAGFDGHEWTTWRILLTRTVWITVIGFLPFNIVLLGVQQNMALFAADLSIGLQQAAHLVPVLATAMLAGKFVFGPLADRVDNRFLYWGALVFFVLSLLVMSTLPGYWMVVMACALLGLGMSANVPLLGSIVASRYGPVAFGRVTGIVYMFLPLSAFGAVIGGYVRHETGGYGPMFWIFLAMLVPGALAMAFLPKTERPKPAAEA